MDVKTDSPLLRYIAELARFAGRDLPVAGLWMLAVGALDGIGLMLLVPLLTLIDPRGGGGHPLAEGLSRAMEGIGIPFTLPAILVTYVVLIGFKSLASRARDLRVVALRLGFVDHLRNRLYRRIAYSEWLFFSGTRAAEFSHALTQEVQRIGQGTYHLLMFATTAVISAAYLVVAFGLSAAFTLVAFGCGVALLLPLRRLQRRSIGLGRRMSAGQLGVFAASNELLGGMKAAKAHRAERRHVEQFVRHADRQRAAQLGFQRVAGAARVWYTWGAAIAMALLVWVAVEWLVVPVVELLVLVAIFSRLAPQFSSMQQGYQQVLHMLPAYVAFRDLERRCEEAAEPADDAVPPPSFSRELRVEGVGFRYRKERSEAALSAVDMVVRARETLALVGPSGGGKSTLADLLCGLLAPDSGRILIDGRPLDATTRRSWRRRIAYVPQESFLLNDTVRANLRWACPDADERALRRALRMAAADGFVDRLPDGIDSVVGERGVRLSGGERQRIALARALLREPDLLILDEATSALDQENERAIQHAIDALHGDLTLVVIAHRLATVRHADRVVVLDHGRVVEEGAWDELAQRDGGRLRAMIGE